MTIIATENHLKNQQNIKIKSVIVCTNPQRPSQLLQFLYSNAFLQNCKQQIMFADRSKKQFPKMFSEAHLQRLNPHKNTQQIVCGPFESARKLHSRSPFNQKLSSVSPRRKKLKATTSKLFQAAHLPVSGETYLQHTPSKGTQVRTNRHIVRAMSNEDMRIAHSLKQRKLDISNQFAIKIAAQNSILSLIINQFNEGASMSQLAEVLESSGETLRIDSILSSNPEEFGTI